MKEKFVVIGSNSFSGSSFIDYVLRDNPYASVVGISRSAEQKNHFLPYKKIVANDKFHFHQLDLNIHLDRIIEIIQEFRPDYIVNFAAQGMVAQSWDAPEQWFQTNCLAIMKLARCLVKEKYLKRYVQVSSPEVYGSCSSLKEENAFFRPSTPYAASKACGDISLYPFFLNKSLPLVYTRSTNVYGPYQQLYRIIPRAILFIKKGIKIPLQGGGKAIKSYIHIRDTCDATLRIARSGRNGEVYHISPNRDGIISIYEVVKGICKRMGRQIEDCIEIAQDRLGQDSVYIIDSSKARNELGWEPAISLEDGLSETIKWIEENWEVIKREPIDYIHKP